MPAVGQSLKGKALERSLTVLLPVCDAQATLAATISEVLDIAADLTDRFELVIIDDGSADATSEVAHELRRHYPQVRVVRHGKPLGWDAALRTGLAHSHGEHILVCEPGQPKLQRLERGSRPARPNFLGRPQRFAVTE
jgi:hypothetical protein